MSNTKRYKHGFIKMKEDASGKYMEAIESEIVENQRDEAFAKIDTADKKLKALIALIVKDMSAQDKINLITQLCNIDMNSREATIYLSPNKIEVVGTSEIY